MQIKSPQLNNGLIWVTDFTTETFLKSQSQRRLTEQIKDICPWDGSPLKAL